MNVNTKEDTTQVDTSIASLSADMSLLDELFPSLGNGESSGNHFTNQLALLLNNLGSSDDEGSNGPNLFNPLQLSPPRLNEIHALATANLISQTQEAIMQEYNITDFAFDKSTHTGIFENEELINNETCFQNESNDIYNSVEVNRQKEHNLENATPSVNITPRSIVENADLDTDKTKTYFDLGGQKTLTGNCITEDDLDTDKTAFTKVKVKACDETVSIDKVKDYISAVSKQQNHKNGKTQHTCKQDLEMQSAVDSILDTGGTIQNKSVVNTDSANLLQTDRKEELSGTHFHYSITRPNFNEKSQPKSEQKQSMEISSAEPRKRDSDIKRNHDVLNYVLPSKRRHLESNTVTLTFTDTKSKVEHEKDNVQCNRLHGIAESGRMETDCKESGKASSTEKSILYICVICMKQFSNVDDLELHSTNHQQYICPYPGCVRTFTYRSHLSYHRQTHEGQKNHQCSECGKVFTKAQHLDVHMMAHREVKPFTCNICRKTFTTTGNLKNHSRTHSGERPFVCDIKGCTKTFAELSSLKKHKVTHTGEKSFRCEVCGKSFTQASSRSYHMKKHKDVS